jgi:hypothetical protein
MAVLHRVGPHASLSDPLEPGGNQLRDGQEANGEKRHGNHDFDETEPGLAAG